ncbi:ABC transporter permease [Arsenicitalea aurantiaca]|uniref:ABC transporter permease n=1 Tax=Arsenicitalea aurantiaca TaxID=1783274 RepID=A0A433X7U6_9HYPH|nr:ABC transporter permease [Arsenicitalea aurantiaca]RUT30120.1 ABC transporter permease [Arsenicitalea aurantiaca]
MGQALTRSTPFAIGVVLAVLVLVWYAAAIPMNAPWQQGVYGRAGAVDVPFTQFVGDVWNQDKPILPTPHQVVREIWNTTALVPPHMPRSLLFHAWITLSATLAGFGIGTVLGIGLAVLIVHNRATNRSLMPWIIASQTIPILALAPLIVVIGFNIFTGQLGLPPDPARFLSKAIISAYLSFFPVAVGMVKGLRAPEQIQLDLLATYSASPAQTFWRLRWPSALPYLFASMKVGVAASLVGAVVGELPTGAVAGLGARLLAGSYYGQTIQIWSALFVASILAALLVLAVTLTERLVNRRLGARPA